MTASNSDREKMNNNLINQIALNLGWESNARENNSLEDWLRNRYKLKI